MRWALERLRAGLTSIVVVEPTLIMTGAKTLRDVIIYPAMRQLLGES
jgi:hypothetical protein